MTTKPDEQAPRSLNRWVRVSLAARLIFLIFVFLAVPLVLYRLFEAADEDKRQLLLSGVYERGRLVTEVLRNRLETGGPGALPEISDRLQVFSAPDTMLRLFFRPTDAEEDNFFYVAAAPARSAEELAAEQQEMEALGMFNQLATACVSGAPQVARHQIGLRKEEVVTSVTPLLTPGGCWTLVTALSTAAFKDSSIGRPYWRTPEIRLGAVIYLSMFLVTVTVFWGIWRGLRRLTEQARTIRTHGVRGHSFADPGGPAEFVEVARELDRLVATLDSSANTLREIATENAHAFKTPVAVISQALEPLKRRADEPRTARAVEMIELSLEKLDDLIASAWRVDELMANLIDPARERVDLSAIMTQIGRDFATLAIGRRVTVVSDIAPDVHVLGSSDLLEAIIENLVDNAVSFTPSGGQVRLGLVADKTHATISVVDDGPGVPPDCLPKIFDRYFSTRAIDTAAGHAQHLGIGLWVVQRNVTALNGTITAENRPEGGLRMVVRLPRVA